jgi:D-alanyl-D-alanine carboxypeptidase (penicillin-binding protein 5/6)
MTKLMTAYVVFDQLAKGNISLTNQCVIGKDAWRKSGSTMFLNYGDVVSINGLITGLLVVSGNDAAVALAEATSGSVEEFADLMNKTAKKIGLKNSNFRNPHGLNQHNHYMSLRDLAKLAARISSDFPQHLHYFSTTKFTYQNITQRNRNPLIKKSYEGVTGMKTGHTSDGGYGVVGTATRGSRRLIAVVNKARTPKQREELIIELLDFGFNKYKKITIFNKNQPITKIPTWLGEKSTVEAVSAENIAITLPQNQKLNNVKVKVKYKGPIYTPIYKNKKIGTIVVEVAGKKMKELPIFANENIDKANYFKRIWTVAKYKGNQFIKSIKNHN